MKSLYLYYLYYYLFILFSIICIIIYSYFHYSMWNLENTIESLYKDLLEDLKDKVNLILTLNYILITEFELYFN